MTPQQRFAELVQEFAGHPRVTHGADGRRGFGSSALKVDGKIFAMLTADRLVVKLARQRVDELVAAGEGQRLDQGNGRLMREWLSLHGTTGWQALATESLAFVGPE